MRVVFVVGPTGSGKSQWALELAQKYNGVIINCDSIQIYKNLDIGSAKPSLEERSLRPHYLYDLIAPPQEVTAGQYARLFFETLDEIKETAQLAFVVGGTGFYFQAIEKGMYSIGAANVEVKLQVEFELRQNGGAGRLYSELLSRDPDSARLISPNDHYRLGRAIEVIRAHGRKLSEIKQEFAANARKFPYPLIKIGLQIPKEELLKNVIIRTDKMLDLGLINEVELLLRQGYSDWAPLRSVGYHETADFLRLNSETRSMQSLRNMIVQNTMRLAKKQRTWFKRDHQIHWFSFSERSKAEALL